MRTYTRYLLVLAMSIVVFTSCRKSASKQAKYIPKAATMVAAVNAKAIAKKLYSGSFTLDSFAAAVHDTAEQRHWKENMQKIDELKDAGIDWDSDVLAFFAQKGGMMQGQQTTAGAVALLSDGAKLEAFIKKQHKDVKIEKGTDYTYANVDDDMIIGWNKEVAVVLGGSAPQTMFRDSLDTAQPAKFNAAAELALLMKLKKDESIAALDPFNDLLKEKADMKFFSNPSSSIESVPMLGMTKITELVKDSYTSGTVNFEDGKIVGEFTSHSNKDMANIIEKNAKGDADLAMIDAAPTKPTVFMAASFNPQLIVDVLKFIGLEKTADDFLATSMKMSSAEILKAFNGDMALMMSDFHSIDSLSAPQTKEMNFVFNAKVGDKAAYDKLMAKLEEQKVVVRTDKGFASPMAGGMDMSTEFNNTNILVASDSSYLQQYKAGAKKDNISSEIRDKVKGKPFAMYVDIAGILNGFSDTAASVRTAKATFRDAVMTSDHIKGKEMKGKFEMRFLNEKENSLTSLMRWLSKVAAEPRKMKWNDDMQVDTTAIAAPIPTSSL